MFNAGMFVICTVMGIFFAQSSIDASLAIGWGSLFVGIFPNCTFFHDCIQKMFMGNQVILFFYTINGWPLNINELKRQFYQQTLLQVHEVIFFKTIISVHISSLIDQ